MGPGPSDVSDAVRQALARPTIGHLDPAFISVMDEVRDMLQVAFGTRNALTFPVSATGSAGMECGLVNLIEPGDRVVIGVNGVFGGRMCEVARRAGAEVVPVAAPWGEPVSLDALRETLAGQPTALVCLVHAETSTGVLQPLDGLRALCDEVGALLLLDTVTSLGGTPVDLDEHGVDAAYSGTQKCLSCPPGLSPVSFSERAMAKVRGRTTPVQSWYLDLNLLGRYWLGEGGKRAYHHTAPVNLCVALHEALREVLLEGLECRFARHQLHGEALWAGLGAMGLELPVDPAWRLPQLTVVKIPEGVTDAAVRGRLLHHYGIEIGGGLGDLAGKAWRIGLMGAASTPRNILTCLAALGSALQTAGFTPRGDGIAAAEARLGRG